MTTIIYCDGVMAGDSRAYSGSRIPIGSKRKVHRLDDGTLVGVSSSVPGTPEAFVDFIASNGTRDRLGGAPDFLAIVVRPSGEVYHYSSSRVGSGPLTGGPFAVGSGAEFALGALAAGVSLERALQIAAELDPWSAGPFTFEKLVCPSSVTICDQATDFAAPSPPLELEVMLVDLVSATATCDDGRSYPITNFINSAGEEARDPVSARAIVVCLAADRWMSVNISERFFAQTATYGVLKRVLTLN